VTVDQSARTGQDGESDVEAAALTATVLTAVERQLSRYFTAMTQRVDATLAEAEHARAAARAELAQFDQRLATFAAQPAGVSPEDLLQIHQSMREDIWRSLAPVTERLVALADASRRTDDQATAFVHDVKTTTATLVARIDDGDQRVAAEAGRLLSETSSTISARVDGVESAAAERAATAEGHVAALQASTDARVAELEFATSARDDELSAQVCAVGARASDALILATSRLNDLEARVSSANLQLATLATRVEGIDQEAIEDMKSQMSSAIGEAMLVRIELDRVQTTFDDKLDKTTVRLGEIEALLTDHMDVGAAVQLERLDELERAIMLLDPAQFVTKDEFLIRSSEKTVDPGLNGADHSGEQALNGSDGHRALQKEHTGGAPFDGSHHTHSSDELSSSEAWS
jgi:hypothetical protein